MADKQWEDVALHYKPRKMADEQWEDALHTLSAEEGRMLFYE